MLCALRGSRQAAFICCFREHYTELHNSIVEGETQETLFFTKNETGVNMHIRSETVIC